MGDKGKPSTGEAPVPAVNHGVVIKGLHCRHCVGYCRMAIMDKVCKDFGKQPWSKPCRSFVLDTFSDKTASDGSKTLIDLVKSYRPKDLIFMSALLNQESITRRNGYYFGQTVWIRMAATDYLSNYAVARIMHVRKDKAYVQSGKTKAIFQTKSVLTFKQFDKKRAALLEANRLIDPSYKQITGKSRPNVADLRSPKYKCPSLSRFHASVSSVPVSTKGKNRKAGKPQRSSRVSKNLISRKVRK